MEKKGTKKQICDTSSFSRFHLSLFAMVPVESRRKNERDACRTRLESKLDLHLLNSTRSFWLRGLALGERFGGGGGRGPI